MLLFKKKKISSLVNILVLSLLIVLVFTNLASADEEEDEGDEGDDEVDDEGIDDEETVKCYSCEGECNPPFEETTCSSGENGTAGCKNVRYKEGEKETMWKGCFDKGCMKHIEEINSTDKVVLSCDECFSDLCNEGTSILNMAFGFCNLGIVLYTTFATWK